VGDYALVRRQFAVFECALKKFGGDVALWVAYIRKARDEGACALVGRLYARCVRPPPPRARADDGRRALQRHPGEPALYVLTAAHELAAGAGGVEAAWTLLQGGVHMNSERAELWAELRAELVRVELSFVEGLRRGWDVLGVKVGGEAMAMDVDDEARDEVMRGAIVVIHGPWDMADVT
jgi:U3 small nucleolar RNA-associated protein 6